jgi:hypothetical protein
VLRVILSSLSVVQTILFGWFAVFWMMWIAIGNLGMRPWGLMPIAVSWSLVETGVATWILHRPMQRVA